MEDEVEKKSVVQLTAELPTVSSSKDNMIQTISEDATDKAEKKPAGEKSPKSKTTSSDPTSTTDKVSSLINNVIDPPSASALLRKRQQTTTNAYPGCESDSE